MKFNFIAVLAFQKENNGHEKNIEKNLTKHMCLQITVTTSIVERQKARQYLKWSAIAYDIKEMVSGLFHQEIAKVQSILLNDSYFF